MFTVNGHWIILTTILFGKYWIIQVINSAVLISTGYWKKGILSFLVLFPSLFFYHSCFFFTNSFSDEDCERKDTAITTLSRNEEGMKRRKEKMKKKKGKKLIKIPFQFLDFASLHFLKEKNRHERKVNKRERERPP